MKREEAIAVLVNYRMEQAFSAIEDAKCLEEGKGSVRSIINRSYYAMFYALLALLLVEGKSYSRHSGVITAFNTFFVRPGQLPKSLSVDMHKVFELCQEHDYKITSNPSDDEAHKTIRVAEHFVKAIRQFLAANKKQL
ncbi:MAG TPA: HEPN domain-containing protein [Candidatus Hydrogenedentes bacterium]|jgi:uncharacterized protein (UPF0332 family)|nr:MAG: HEPN domain protein [Candidatus Hydrogenedentes bacterium ADurb.Bin179]HOC67696.1 HEPN domain-containing protein [Candidatus Hydrogenedentota bacterium]HQM99719.1 HEPN domain-containing protein [Candidatus Hydrogenedentota bacterium]